MSVSCVKLLIQFAVEGSLSGAYSHYPYEVGAADEISTRSRTSKSPRTCSISPGTSCSRSRGGSSRTSSKTTMKPALVDLINQKPAGKPVTAKLSKPVKKPRKAAAGQKEMLMSIQGKKPAKETAAKKPTARQRKSA
jgi:DNA end-binding protein Ku